MLNLGSPSFQLGSVVSGVQDLVLQSDETLSGKGDEGSNSDTGSDLRK